MPDPLEDFAYRAHGAQDRERIDGAMIEVVGAFREAGIDALVLKGPVTARWLYGPGEVRGYTDCDILAQPDRFVTAARALEQLGFHSHGDEATHPEVWEDGRSQVWHRLPEDVWIDLQWRLPGIGLQPAAAWELLWAARETMRIAGALIEVPGEPARAMHLALATADNPESRKAQLDLERGVRDLDEAVWQQAAALAGELEATGLMAAGLAAVPAGAALAARLDITES
jgi:hypothetical protein